MTSFLKNSGEGTDTQSTFDRGGDVRSSFCCWLAEVDAVIGELENSIFETLSGQKLRDVSLSLP